MPAGSVPSRMPSSSSRRGSSWTPKLSIGQVLQRLGSDHPDLTPSKLRFLEEQGLITPARTESGYRKFSDGDVDRIRTILVLQRDHYLPLKVIGDYLYSLDRGERPELPGAAAGPGTALITDDDCDSGELCRRAGTDADLLTRAQTAGLIPRRERYDDSDLSLLSALAELERRGLEPRHLRQIRQLVLHELGLVEQAIGAVSRRDHSTSRERDDDAAAELVGALDRVHRAMLLSALRDGSR